MASPTPFSFAGSLNIPEGPGLPQEPIPINMSGTFLQMAQFVLNFTGSGTQMVNLGTITSPGIKGLLIAVDAASTLPTVLVKINGSSTGGIEVSSGGFLAVGSPSPTSGITGVVIDYTAACVVRIWVLG